MQGIVLFIWAAAWGIALWRWAKMGEPPEVPLVLNGIFALALGILTAKDLPLLINAWRRKGNGQT